MKFRWYHRVEAWAEAIWLILRYGIEEAEKRIDAEKEELRRRMLDKDYYKEKEWIKEEDKR